MATAPMTTDLVRLTARAVDLSALAFVTVAGALTIVAVGALDRAAVGPTAQACGGALAAAAALALRDPARELLDAVPMSPRLRLLQRSAVIVPSTLLAALLLGVLAQRSVGGSSFVVSGVESVLALVGVGIAATACCARRWPDAAPGAGAAVALGWSTASTFLPATGGWFWSAWTTHPWIVIVTTAALTWLASTDR